MIDKEMTIGEGLAKTAKFICLPMELYTESAYRRLAGTDAGKPFDFSEASDKPILAMMAGLGVFTGALAGATCVSSDPSLITLAVSPIVKTAIGGVVGGVAMPWAAFNFYYLGFGVFFDARHAYNKISNTSAFRKASEKIANRPRLNLGRHLPRVQIPHISESKTFRKGQKKVRSVLDTPIGRLMGRNKNNGPKV
jgi:hypothetical protein